MATSSSLLSIMEEEQHHHIKKAAAHTGSNELAGCPGVAKQEIKPPPTKKKKKKKVVRRMPQDEVDYVLSYEVESDDPDMECFEEEYPDIV
jgi:hypothetical protein